MINTSTILWLLIVTIYLTSAQPQPEYDVVDSSVTYKRLKCYACTSYVPNCQNTVNDTSGGVPHVGCKSRCFVRQGYEKELPIYRGCLDDFMSVPVLKTDYTGCRSQTWNGVDRLWCFCDTDMCNGDSLQALQSGSGDTYSANLGRDDNKPDFLHDVGNKDNFHDSYAQQQQPATKYASVQEYAKESTDVPPYDYNSQERYTDVGVDRPYFPSSEKIYTDIEQYGRDNTAFRKPNVNKPRYGNPAQYRPYAPPQKPHRDLDPYDTSFVQQPYYPYEQTKPAHKEVKYHDVRSGKYEQHVEMQTKFPPQDGAGAGAGQFGAPYEEHSSSYHSTTSSAVSTTASSPTAGLPDRVLCSHTGFIPNPDDCSSFLACIMDAHVGKPLMHRMRCPAGLFWDNSVRTCVLSSSTCNMKKVYEVEYRDPPTPPQRGGYKAGQPATTFTSRPKSHTNTYAEVNN